MLVYQKILHPSVGVPKIEFLLMLPDLRPPHPELAGPKWLEGQGSQRGATA